MLYHQVLDLFGVEKISWFSEFSTAFIANVVTNTWLGFPFMMVVSLGALQSIPQDVYEAAEVDGASRWQAFWQITLPLLRPALFWALPPSVSSAFWSPHIAMQKCLKSPFQAISPRTWPGRLIKP